MSEITVVEADINGLATTVAQLPGTRTAAGVLHVGCGYAHDPPGRGGTAHATEHVRAAGVAGRHGLRPQAATESMWTRFTLTAPASDLGRLCPALTSVLLPAGDADPLWDVERRAILIELARLTDQPQLRLAPVIAARSFPDCDAAAADRATPDLVRDLGTGEIEAFAATRYRRDRSTLTLVGPQKVDALLQAVERSPAEPEQPTGPGPAEPVIDDPPPDEPLPGLGDLFIVALAARGDVSAAVREVAVEAILGRHGVLESVAARAGVAATGFAVLNGVRGDVAVMAWPDGDRLAEAVSAATTTAIAEPADGSGLERDAVAAARRRLTQASVLAQQTPAGLARLLSRYTSGLGSWPDLARHARAHEDEVRAAMHAVLGSAKLWHLSGGHLTEGLIYT